MRPRTRAEVDQVIFEVVWVDVRRLQPTARLVEDLGIDSLERIDVAVALEDAFGIEISDVEFEAWETVADIHAQLGVQR